MRVRIEPAIRDWPTPTRDRPIVTGHQVPLFHPGILAKYLAVDAVLSKDLPANTSRPSFRGLSAAKGGITSYGLNIVVDQDVYDPLTLMIPVSDGDRLRIEKVTLGRIIPEVPAGCQPAIGPAVIRENAKQLPADLSDKITAAFDRATDAPSLAAQMWAVLRQMMQGLCDPPLEIYASQMLRDDAHAWVLDALLRDAMHGMRQYNDAVADHPEAGMTPMRIEQDRVEVPLWQLQWMRPRKRVFVDMADSTPIFTTEDGGPIGDPATLAPRALLMTALLRRPQRCSLFVHGAGGWVYDRITEQWWLNWRGEAPAPMAVATADVYLDFDAPVNTRAELERAVWRRHYLPHNVDRELGVEDELVRQKRELLARMDDDRDRKRRREVFDELHRINDALCKRHPEAIAAAERGLQRARVGVTNQAIARRRDWFFGLYSNETLAELREAIACACGHPPAEASGPRWR